MTAPTTPARSGAPDPALGQDLGWEDMTPQFLLAPPEVRASIVTAAGPGIR